jgi:hypothetical protein
MSHHAPLAAFSLWAFFIATVVAIVLAHEWGYRLGRRRGRRAYQENPASVGVMVGAELSLLAFLLTLTYGMAASRFDTRRQVLLDEVNAIGTAYFRAAVLPEPPRAEIRRALREYVDVRIAAAQEDSLAQAIRGSEDLLGQLWTQAVAAAEQDPHSVPRGRDPLVRCDGLSGWFARVESVPGGVDRGPDVRGSSVVDRRPGPPKSGFAAGEPTADDRPAEHDGGLEPLKWPVKMACPTRPFSGMSDKGQYVNYVGQKT